MAHGRVSGSLVNALFSSDSCTPSTAAVVNPADPAECVAVGWYLSGGDYPGLAESSDGGRWYSGDGVGTPPAPNDITDPVEVSCAVVTADIPDCLLVGEHYNYNGTGVQLAAWGNANFFQPVVTRNPRGATWSVMDDVSCPTDTFCMVVGTAGRKHTMSSTAFSWNGNRMRQLTIPAPRHSHNSELGALSCATATSCVALGNYQNRAGKELSYALIWTSGKWRLQHTPSVARQKASFFNAVSCPTVTSCVAVGVSTLGARTHQFAEAWNGSKWRIVSMPARSDSGMNAVSCPVPGTCFASGWYKQVGLMVKWNGVRWSVVRTAAHASGFTFSHVSCISVTSCEAVGYRYTKARFSDRTLAEKWNGTTWALQITQNN